MTSFALPGIRRRPRGREALLLCAALLAALPAGGAEPAQAPEPGETGGMAEPLRGVTANGQPVFGLFPIESTGVPTAPLAEAAGALLEALGADQQKRARFPVDGPEWRNWNPHRQDASGAGVSLAAMSEAARGAALELLQAALSGRGFELARDIMSGGPGSEGSANAGEWEYRIAVLGDPSASEPWGWQLEGEHLVINYFVLGEQVVMSPVFLGSTAGRTAGLQEEETAGTAMLQALSEAQREMASIEVAGDGGGIVAGASRDNAVLENVGIPASLMDGEQRARLLELVERYVGNLREGHAAVKMAQVEAYLDDTYFAWFGEEDTVSYYRVFSPVILIEFERGQDPAHAHAVIRTPNGNDYGMALLARHLAEHPHD